MVLRQLCNPLISRLDKVILWYSYHDDLCRSSHLPPWHPTSRQANVGSTEWTTFRHNLQHIIGNLSFHLMYWKPSAKDDDFVTAIKTLATSMQSLATSTGRISEIPRSRTQLSLRSLCRSLSWRKEDSSVFSVRCSTFAGMQGRGIHRLRRRTVHPHMAHQEDFPARPLPFELADLLQSEVSRLKPKLAPGPDLIEATVLTNNQYTLDCYSIYPRFV